MGQSRTYHQGLSRQERGKGDYSGGSEAAGLTRKEEAAAENRHLNTSSSGMRGGEGALPETEGR